MVVADAGPLHYLVLIEEVEVLEPLYGRVFIPQSVAWELQHAATPAAVRSWIGRLPDWCEVRPNPVELSLHSLDPGERATILLAASLAADRVLMDDWEGRIEAARRHLRVTGTLGIIAEAHQRRMLDFEESLARLRQTNFYMSAELVGRIRQMISTP